jgi:hypothetical protein
MCPFKWCSCVQTSLVFFMYRSAGCNFLFFPKLNPSKPSEDGSDFCTFEVLHTFVNHWIRWYNVTLLCRSKSVQHGQWRLSQVSILFHHSSKYSITVMVQL